MTEMDDTVLQSPEFQFEGGGYTAIIRKHGDGLWDIRDLFGKPIGYLALAYHAVDDAEVHYTVGLPSESQSVTEATSPDWRELVVRLLAMHSQVS
jgi:hypothetical protein